MMFEAFGFSKGAPCSAETYLSYLRTSYFGRLAPLCLNLTFSSPQIDLTELTHDLLSGK